MRTLGRLLACSLMLVGSTGEARSDFDLCNRTPWWLDANLTYGFEGRYTSIGGPRLLLPGDCKTLLEGPLDLSMAYYLTALTASGAYEQPPGWRLPTDYALCNVDGRRMFFKADQPQPCEDDELTFANWRRVVPDAADFSVAFTSEPGWTLEQARIAGAQQLLSLLGYDVGAVDAVAGRRTAAGLRRYQADHGLAVDGLVTPEVVQALASSLRQRFASRKIPLQRPDR